MNSQPPTLETLAVRVTSLEKSSADNHESHGGIYSRLSKIEQENAVINNSLSSIREMLATIQKDVQAVKDRPSNRYYKLSDAILQWAVIGLFGIALASKFFD